jgi:peroxiredoxin Q/BCP
LLSDPELKAIKAYDVWQEKKLYGKIGFGVVRTTYLISPDGNIEKVFPKANPKTNAVEVLEYIGGIYEN